MSESTVQAEIPGKNPTSVLAVDLGIHNIATTVNSVDGKPKFYGKRLRAVRGHYFHLRRKLPDYLVLDEKLRVLLLTLVVMSFAGNFYVKRHKGVKEG